MSRPQKKVLILALPETAGSALYGMVDVLSATGNIWQTLVGHESPSKPFDVQIVSVDSKPFRCGHGIPVEPAYPIADAPASDIQILPEIWLGPQEVISDRYDGLMDWIKLRFRSGTTIYSACSGSVLLAESGLLDNCEATSHWGYQELFRMHYPKVRFRPESNLVYAHPDGRLVTAGGTTSWHDLALHIIARHVGVGEALRIAKVYLLKWHQEGQLPFAGLVRQTHHADSAVRKCEEWLKVHYRDPAAISLLVEASSLPERTLKRRFKAATGSSMIEYLQNHRIEEGKRHLEEGKLSVEDVSLAVGYEDLSFFRRLFKRLTGLTPGEYRRLFRPLIEESAAPAGF
ncbi:MULTISPECIES: GlxA family transcriptional regulator [unclassified Ketobacter]|uniref:GlxA family transcriptional regulator n=1 Tax=unclassified Ketobacter TaxID=2639109 RepID=UPI000F244EAD|nr:MULTISPECIES: helix-turn-helix domain-containing protein [unclassified Ketobacter]RLT91029.1 MAG: helix-turn-helix domain-containing protein [Ketobacter sp. GenoA1]RLT98537.1 MAG: helix-turn-helix domain-containing protein [Ketobacter sp.]